MADEREGRTQPTGKGATRDKVTTPGRKQNAAQPLNASENRAGPQRYPSVRQDDAVEPRSFDPGAETPTPRQGAGDTSPKAANEGRMGPAGDPAEGKP